ncbi:uncharacterized protein [Asterias amurensis]|uniref:uncharacterized protein n=1 Tax=Asterias amurensis TaxID=7602 RepID=UPI003AB75A60
MTKRCVAAGCSNTTSAGVSLHKFPLDPKIRRIWAKKVRLTRAKWQGPTEHSTLCCSHFTPECFEGGLHQEFGLKRKRFLKPEAIPTIFRATEKSPVKKKHRKGIQKREKVKLLKELLSPVAESTSACSSSTSTDQDMDSDQSYGEIDHVASASHSVSVQCQTTPCTTHVATQTRLPTRVKLVQASAHMHCTGIQAQPRTVSCGVICKLLDDVPTQESSSDSSNDDDGRDPEYQPCYDSPSSDSDGSSSTHNNEGSSNIHKERKFIVFESQLMKLFNRCISCGGYLVTMKSSRKGGMLRVRQSCEICDDITTWDSQPWLNNTPAGNILLSASILFAGGTVAQTFRVLRHMGVATMTQRNFFKHQKQFLLPAVNAVFVSKQRRLIMEIAAEGDPLVIGGDGRADSPGHSAKYGSYTALDLERNKILDIQLVQSNEVKGSYHMELEGFKRTLEKLNTSGLVVSKLVSDRHRQLAKYVREKTDISHMFDVWHIAKGLKKKVDKLSKVKNCGAVTEWSKSLNHHIYWCASSTTDDQSALRAAKWLSIVNHIQGVHHGHSELYPNCEHDILDGDRKKKYMKPSTLATEKLTSILTKTMLLNDIKMMSTTRQTSSLESFHSVLNYFAPKMNAYTYHGMTCRLQMTALHYNEISDSAQAKTRAGNLRYQLNKPKYKKGSATVKAVKEPCKYGYVDELMAEVVRRVKTSSRELMKKPPPTLCSVYKFPPKDELISRHRTRFNLL